MAGQEPGQQPERGEGAPGGTGWRRGRTQPEAGRREEEMEETEEMAEMATEPQPDADRKTKDRKTDAGSEPPAGDHSTGGMACPPTRTPF